MGAETVEARAAAVPGVPDVTVVVPVYNTMPYLTACLDSLVGQSIGHDRLQVVAVDDGSTDGSGEELDRYAEQYPHLVTVLHQENSGGPADPCNRGLDVATGRYVFFLGADDYLGERALEQLVDRADEWESDVVMGKMVGVGGRGVSQMLFDHDERDVPFPHSKLPFALANTKLFRRSLLEDHKIRYGHDLRVGSDQPFTIEAMLRARRISVLADDTYYYAVRRENSSNITFSSGWRARIEDIGTVMRHVAKLVPPGDDRDQILQRHFQWELNNRVRLDMLYLGEDEQREMCAMVARLADEYLTDGVSERLPVGARVRLRLAQCGHLAALRRLLEFGRDQRRPPLALVGDDVCLAYPGFDDFPHEWFVVKNTNLRERFRSAVRLISAHWQGSILEITAATDLHPVSADRVHVDLVPVKQNVGILPFRRLPRGAKRPHSWPVTLEEEAHTSGSRLTARVDVSSLFDLPAGPRRRWALRLRLDAGERGFDLPVTGAPAASAQVRQGSAFFKVDLAIGREGRLYVTRERIPFREAVSSRLRR